MADNTRRAKWKFYDEPMKLTELVLKTAGVSSDDSFTEFVWHRYWRPFDYSVRWSMNYSFAFTALTILVIAAGVASSVIASMSGHEGDVAIAVLGVLVAVMAAANRLWRPGPRAVLRHRAANDLRREGWRFVCGQGRYSDGAAEDRRKVFFEEIEAINRTPEAIDEREMESGDGG
jgi:Protein of unknown function (DUF4231)